MHRQAPPRSVSRTQRSSTSPNPLLCPVFCRPFPASIAMVCFAALSACSSPPPSEPETPPTTSQASAPPISPSAKLLNALKTHANTCAPSPKPCATPQPLQKLIQDTPPHITAHTALEALQTAPPSHIDALLRPLHDTDLSLHTGTIPNLHRALQNNPDTSPPTLRFFLARLVVSTPNIEESCGTKLSLCARVLPFALQTPSLKTFESLRTFTEQSSPHPILQQSALRAPRTQPLPPKLLQPVCAWVASYTQSKDLRTSDQAFASLRVCPNGIDTALQELEHRAKQRTVTFRMVRALGFLTRQTNLPPETHARARTLLRSLATPNQTPVRVRAEALWNFTRIPAPLSPQDRVWIESFQGHKRAPLRDAAARSIGFLRDQDRAKNAAPSKTPAP